MKQIGFTHENRAKTRNGTKTATRRIGENPLNLSPCDRVVLLEPTKVVSLNNDSAIVQYPDDGILFTKRDCAISEVSFKKLMNRKDPCRTAIALFMLDDFARHYIEITGIKVESLQDITKEGAIAEGGKSIADFRLLWNSIHKEPEKRWDANPIVTEYRYQYLEEI